MALAAVAAALFLTFLDNTIVSVALANVQSSLGVGVSGLQWVVDGYMLAFAALMLTGGTLGDLFGRKRIMLGGLALFAAGSLLGALAPGPGVLIVARVVMGVGAAASEPGTLSIIRHVYPERRARARALGVWSAVSGLALALGPILGGVLVGGGGWRAVFWFNVGFAVVAFALALAVVPESSDPEGRHIDWPGLVLGAGSLAAASVAVIEGENAGYSAWWIDLLFAGSVLAGIAFVEVESRSRDPLVRIEFLRRPAFAIANLVAFATNFAVFAVFFFTALYLQLVAGFSGWQIAVQFIAMAVAMALAGPLAGRWTARAGPREPMVVGCLLAGGGMFAVDALLSPEVPVGALSAALAVVGCGFGLALVAMTASVLALVPPERSGMAASTVNTSRELGGVFGVAVLGALVNGQLTSSLVHKLTALGVPANFRSIVIDAVTHGTAVPPSATAVHNSAARGHAALVAKVIDAAEQAFGDGLHVSLVVAGSVLLACGAVAQLAPYLERRQRRFSP